MQYEDPIQPLSRLNKRYGYLQSTTKAGLWVVYVISNNSAVKIGFTNQLKHRMSTLQVASPTLLDLLLILEPYDHVANTLEKILHKRYEAYALQGEWFDIGALWIMADIGSAVARGELPAALVLPIREVPKLADMVYERDVLYDKAVETVKLEGRASISLFQKRLGVGFERAKGIYSYMERNRVFSRMGLTRNPQGGYY